MKKIIWMKAIASIAFAGSSLASDRVGNGGFAHVCRDNAGQIVSARLLDLWEADSLRPLSNDRPVDIQVEEALAKLKAFSPNSYYAIAQRYDQLKKAVVKTQRPLSKTDDAFPPYHPAPGCDYEQVARFEPVLTEVGTSGLRIHSEIYDSPLFSNSDRAALFVHEAVYLVDRLRTGATNSQRARTLTGHLMSESVVPDAVRMLFLYVIGSAHYFDGAGEHFRTILSVADPKNIRASIRFHEIDGISHVSESVKSRKYRCIFGNQQFSGEAETDGGYRSIEKWIDYETREPLVASIVTSEFSGNHDDIEGLDLRDIGGGISNSFSAQCFKKSKGKEVRVIFAGTVTFEDAKCTVQSGDGSTFVRQGEDCDIEIQSGAERLRRYPQMNASANYGVVLAAPETK